MYVEVNPYIVGNPVGGSTSFFGRKRILDKVLQILKRPADNTILLYGLRRIGKTSILQQLTSWLNTRGCFYPVYFDLQDKAASTTEEVIGDLAFTIATSFGESLSDFGIDPKKHFKETWLPDLIKRRTQEGPLVLLFDEFDVLTAPKANQAIKSFFPFLRSLLESDPTNLKFVFVIGRNLVDLDNILHSIFKSAQTLRVSLLERKDATELIRTSEKKSKIFSKFLIKHIIVHNFIFR